MAINAKIGADLSAFNANIKQGQTILRSLNAEMKATDAEFKATGNSEQYLANKTRTLNSQLQVQKGIADQAKKALKALDDEGVEPTDAAYQKLYIQMMQATAGMNETQAALNGLSISEQEAAQSADLLTKNVQGIGKKISLEQVIGGIDRITSGMENAAKKALQLGERLWDNIMQSAQWGDDIATQAMMAQMSVEEYQKVVNVAAKNGETSAASLIKSWSKVRMNLTSDTDDVTNAFKELRITTKQWGEAGQSGPALIARDYMDVYWEIGEALMKVTDASKQERLAQTLLGRSWKESLPMFQLGREEYEKAKNAEDVLTNKQINNLGTAYDTVVAVNQKFDTLKNTLIAEIAPTLTDVAGSIGDLLHEINAYLKTEEGQKALADMGSAIGKLFEGLGQLNAEDVVSGFKNVFDKVVNGLEWLANNGGKVITVVEGLGIAWAGLKVGEGALTILKVIGGLKDLLGIGTAATAGGTLATSLSTALTSAAGKAAGVLGNAALQNAVPGVADWFTNNTHLGRWISGTEKPQEYFDQVKKNAETFESDWQNNAIYKAILSWGENNIRYWDKISKTNQLAAEWTLGDEFTADELMQMINNGEPVPIKSDIDMETSAEDIAEQIGTVIIPGVVQVTGDPAYSRRTPGMQGIIPGYANGIRYVSQDNVLALLHKGERVVPAREVSSRNYSSNLYVEKMIMGGGADARGLADEMAAAQRRQASGYGG